MSRFMFFLQRQWGACLLGVWGSILIVAGLVQQVGREVFASGLVGTGVGLIVLAAFYWRLRKGELGPGGVKIALDDQQQREESSLVLSNPDDTLPARYETLEESELVIGARIALAGEAISMLLNPLDGELAGCLLRLYLYDVDEDLLVPVYRSGDPTPPDVASFRIGTGATGTAFARGDYVFVDGPAVYDSTHGLTPEQQIAFRDLTAVAAVPVLDASERVIGVLTVSSTTDEGHDRIASEDGYFDHLSRAFLLARVLVDILKWFEDGYDEP